MADRKAEQDAEKKRRQQEERERREKLALAMKEKRKKAQMLKKGKRKAHLLKLKKLKAAQQKPRSFVLGMLKAFFPKKKGVPGYTRPGKDDQSKPKTGLMTSSSARIQQQNEEWIQKFGNLQGAANPLEEAKKKPGETQHAKTVDGDRFRR